MGAYLKIPAVVGLVAAMACGATIAWRLDAFASAPDATELNAESAPFEIIVDRKGNAIEVFVAADTATLKSAYSAVPPGLLDDNGLVNTSVFRNVSADVGDWIAEHWSVEVAGESVEIEAMAVMVHPSGDYLPFDHPLSAYTAISVCSVPEDAPAIRPEDTRTYAGFIIYPVEADADIRFDLNPQGDGANAVRLAEFRDWEPIGAPRIIASGGDLRLPGR
ncbi:MAG: hypothetical protein AAGB18_01380 [Pseudomonadota bacterium]